MQRFLLMCFTLLLLGGMSAFAQDAPLFTTDFPPEEFAERREKVYDAIGTGGVAVLQGDPTPRGYVKFRQSNEFYYLSGTTDEGSARVFRTISPRFLRAPACRRDTPWSVTDVADVTVDKRCSSARDRP